MLWFGIGGDIKIFSDKQVLTLCEDKENYNRKMTSYKHLSHYFNIPKIVDTNEKDLRIIEEVIDFNPKTDRDYQLILEQIYLDYSAYFQAMQGTSEVREWTIAERLETSKNKAYIEEFDYLLEGIDPDLTNQKWPFLKVHGDLWSANVLIKEEKSIWYIDWDNTGENIFFHDFFKLMWNELDVTGNGSFYKAYLA